MLPGVVVVIPVPSFRGNVANIVQPVVQVCGTAWKVLLILTTTEPQRQPCITVASQ